MQIDQGSGKSDLSIFEVGLQLGGPPKVIQSLVELRSLSIDLTDFVLGARVLALGDGAVEFRGILQPSGALVPDDDSELHRITAVNHCVLAGRLPASGPEGIRPEYLRLPDAEIARRAAGNQ